MFVGFGLFQICSPFSFSPHSKDHTLHQVWKCSPMLLKQHGCQHHLPLPSPSTLPRHLMLSIENASPGLLPPSSLPCHLTLSVEDTSPSLLLPSHPPLCHITQHRASRMPPVCHCPPLCHIISHLALRTCPPACYCSIKSPATSLNTS